jgi:hypothetical protein
MVGVHTRPVATEVVDLQVIGPDRTAVEFPADAMSERPAAALATNAELAVSILRQGTCPEPVSVVGTKNLLLEPLKE